MNKKTEAWLSDPLLGKDNFTQPILGLVSHVLNHLASSLVLQKQRIETDFCVRVKVALALVLRFPPRDFESPT